MLCIMSLSLIKKTKKSYSQREHSIGAQVFKDIKINDINSIKIIKPNLTTITLAKSSGRWDVKTLFGYPADINKLSGLLQEAASLKVIQNVLLAPLAYKKLNLLPPHSQKKGEATEIQFFDKENKLLHSLLIGKKRYEVDLKSRAQVAIGRYVRIPSQKNIILTDELFNDINFKAKDWLSGMEISFNNIKSIKLSKNSGIEWTLSRDSSEDNFKLNGMPKNITLNKRKIEAITNSLSNLKFDSVADNKLPATTTGLKNPVTLTAFTFSGTKLVLNIGKIHQNNRYVKCTIIAPSKKTVTTKQLDQQNLFTKWIYLIDLNRLDPLLSSKDSILKQETKRNAPTNMYSNPIS